MLHTKYTDACVWLIFRLLTRTRVSSFHKLLLNLRWASYNGLLDRKCCQFVYRFIEKYGTTIGTWICQFGRRINVLRSAATYEKLATLIYNVFGEVWKKEATKFWRKKKFLFCCFSCFFCGPSVVACVSSRWMRKVKSANELLKNSSQFAFFKNGEFCGWLLVGVYLIYETSSMMSRERPFCGI